MINADAGVFVALEKGFFRDQGLNVEVTYFSSSGGPQMAALTTGEWTRAAVVSAREFITLSLAAFA